MGQKTLILSQKKTKLTTILPKYLYSSVIEFTDVSELKSYLREQSCDILIIQEPLNKGVGWRFAMECTQMYDMEILLITPNCTYDQVVYQLADTGVFVVRFPYTGDDIYQSIELLRIKHEQMKKYQEEIIRLKSVIEHDRIISRAKLLLIEGYHWSEERAHHFIEQAAMNSSVTKWEVAKKIVEGVVHESK